MVAKATGRKWISSGTVPDGPLDGDVSGGLQVRWTERRDGRLIVRPSDPDSLVCVLVVGPVDSMEVVGWLPCAECKRSYWLGAPGHRPAAYFVPQQVLRPIEELALDARRTGE